MNKKISELGVYIRSTSNLADDFIDRHNKNKKEFLLYGAGYASYWYLEFFKKHNMKPIAIIDKNKKGEVINGIHVIAIEEANNHYSNLEVVIGAPKFRDEIEEMLTQKGWSVYSFEAEIYCTFLTNIELYKKYLLENLSRIENMYNRLSDKKSRQCLIDFIKGRISGDQRFFQDNMVENQYYQVDIFDFTEDEVMIECGANDGETTRQFIKIVGNKYKKIILFEPDRECIKRLTSIVESESNKVELIEKAAWSEKTTLRFEENPDCGTSHVNTSSGNDKCIIIDADTIDDCVDDRVTFIKMDIEGAELNALKGARRTIVNNTPKLAICVYHNASDFLDIFEYLQDIVPQYSFYLRHHNWGATETVIYAVCE